MNKRLNGLVGFFFKIHNPDWLKVWCRAHLGGYYRPVWLHLLMEGCRRRGSLNTMAYG